MEDEHLRALWCTCRAVYVSPSISATPRGKLLEDAFLPKMSAKGRYLMSDKTQQGPSSRCPDGDAGDKEHAFKVVPAHCH